MTEIPYPLDGCKLIISYYQMNGAEAAAAIQSIEADSRRTVRKEKLEPISRISLQYGQKLSAATYTGSLHVWDEVAIVMENLYREYDLFPSPTTAFTAPKINEDSQSDTIRAQMEHVHDCSEVQALEVVPSMFENSLKITPYTQLANLTGQPAIGLPTHSTKEDMSLGIRFMSARGREDLLLQIDYLSEASYQFHLPNPWRQQKQEEEEMKKKRLLALVTSVFFALNARGTAAANQKDHSWNNVKKEKELVVTTSGTLFPASYYDDQNELVGYNVDSAKEVAKHLNVKIPFKEYSVGGQIISASKGESDFATNDFGITKEREKKFSLSEPFKYSSDSIIARKKDNSGIHSLDDFKGKKVAGEPNANCMHLAEKYGAELVIYDNATNNQYLSNVASGRTDAILNDYYLQKMAVPALPDIPVKVLENVHFNKNESGFSLKEGDDALKKKIDDVLKRMKEDGTTKKISEKYFQADVSVKPKEMMTESMSD